MLDARFSHLYFYQSLNRLQRGLSAIAELLVWCNIQTDVRNIGLTCVTYYSNMLPIWLLVWYQWNIRSILLRYCRDIVSTSKEIFLTNLGTILGWYSHNINRLDIWNTPLSDIGMMSEYNRYILANICAILNIGWLLVQYCTNMAVLLGKMRNWNSESLNALVLQHRHYGISVFDQGNSAGNTSSEPMALIYTMRQKKLHHVISVWTLSNLPLFE